MVGIQNSLFPKLRAHSLEYVSYVPELSSSQIWAINVVQKGAGEQKCSKICIFFRAVIKRCVLAEGVACGTN